MIELDVSYKFFPWNYRGDEAGVSVSLLGLTRTTIYPGNASAWEGFWSVLYRVLRDLLHHMTSVWRRTVAPSVA